MDDSSFLARMGVNNNSMCKALLSHSDAIMNKTFERDANYKVGNLYDVNCKLLEEVEFKYQKSFSYSINKDKVEFLVQFRPKYHPEIKYVQEDGLERYGFYLDIPNDVEVPEKWLIFGKNETNSFIRYNVLRCNWTFKWIIDGVVYSVLGCLRNRNNYNSGVWSDGFTTSVENEAMFIVPSNQVTKTIDYNMRFMLSDNIIHPKVYEVSKVEDTFPAGIIKITLVQCHYDAEKDNALLKVCNYYDNAILPVPEDTPEVSYKAELVFNGSTKIIYINGSTRVVTATVFDGERVADEVIPVWFLYLNNEIVSIEDLAEHGIICEKADNNTFNIRAVWGAKNGDILGIRIGAEDLGYYDYAELEVRA